MQILTSLEKTHSLCLQWKKDGESIVLVPTMGYYHKGHEKLFAVARELGSKLAISLFVNPAQFGPGEDLENYPRDFQADCVKAERCGADLLFAPSPQEMYAEDHQAWVDVPQLARGLCGRSRPLHFRGVCTVLMKLFMIMLPDIAVFGQKDWQQQAIVRRMARDLNLPVRIVSVPTQREADGLALSSRNVYLNAEERKQAPGIYAGLGRARNAVSKGERDAGALIESVLSFWREALPLGEIDYLAVVDPETLADVDRIEGSALMACAVRVGKARLIDNIVLTEK